MNIKFILQYAICLVLTVIACSFFQFNVKIEHKFNDRLDIYHKGSVVNGTVYHGGNITSSIYHTGQIRN